MFDQYSFFPLFLRFSRKLFICKLKSTWMKTTSFIIFKKGFSTDTALSYLTDKIQSGFDDGLYTGMILVDLQKAFDHNIFLEKPNCIGFSE